MCPDILSKVAVCQHTLFPVIGKHGRQRILWIWPSSVYVFLYVPTRSEQSLRHSLNVSFQACSVYMQRSKEVSENWLRFFPSIFCRQNSLKLAPNDCLQVRFKIRSSPCSRSGLFACTCTNRHPCVTALRVNSNSESPRTESRFVSVQ